MARYISRAQKKPKKSKVIIFLNIVIGILVAFIIMGLIGFVGSMGDNYYTREFGDTMTSYSIDDGDYADLLNEYYSDYGNFSYLFFAGRLNGLRHFDASLYLLIL